MDEKKLHKVFTRFTVFWLVVSAFYALVFVWAEFAGSPVAGFRGFLTLAGQWLVVGVAAGSVVGLLSVNRYVWAAVGPLLLGVSAVAAYYRLTLGLSMTPALIDLAVTNGLSTWADVITLKLLFFVALAVGVGVLTAWWRVKYVKGPAWSWMWGGVMLLAVLMPVTVIQRFKAPVTARLPYSLWYSVEGYMANRQAVKELRDTYDGVAATAPADAPVVVLVIGESLRPDHLQLNGYARATTPGLAGDTAVVSLPNVTTDFIYTHLSVPHIMTREQDGNPDAAFTEQSFITLFKRAGFHTAWLSNQDEVDTYAYFMHEADTLVQCNGARSFYNYDKWLDSDLERPFTDILGHWEGRKLMVLHTIGSHWWYRSHYPDSLARFKPEIDSRVVSELSREQMINSYDNSILATDSFLCKLIERLSGRNAVMIFISDHGEALGEDGTYLHAGDYPQLHPTACVVWYSHEFARRYPAKVRALKANSEKSYTTGSIFHTVLHAGDVATPVVDHALSMFHYAD